MDVVSALEAILFVAGEPVGASKLARALACSPDEITGALDRLARRYEEISAGVRLLRSAEGFQLVTAPDAQKAVEGFLTASMRERLTPVAAETLAIIAYRGPLSRAAIEAIRGVNSSFTLRLLALRGLVTREPHPHDRRSFVYQISSEFLRHLGVTKIEDLPDYASLRAHAGMTKLAAEAEVPTDATASAEVTTPQAPSSER